MPFDILIFIIIFHLIGDVIIPVITTSYTDLYQSSKYNTTNFGWLTTKHCISYSLCFIWLGLYFALITLILHCIIDSIFYYVNSYILPYNKSLFIICLGIDQCLHYIALYSTYWFLYVKI